MKITTLLKLEKELFFAKYIIQQPFKWIGESFLDIIKTPALWLWVEFGGLMFFVFRKGITQFIQLYPPVIDIFVIYLIVLIFLTWIIGNYLSQDFQKEYSKQKEEEITNAFHSRP